MMKNPNVRIFLSFLFLLLSLFQTGHLHAADQKVVAITQFAEHPALNMVRTGLKAGLKARGFVEGKNLRLIYENAQGDFSLAGQISRKFKGLSPDVIVAISTPSAQSIAAIDKETPIVFSAVTDPVSANLLKNPAYPGGNISGVVDTSPLYQHLDLIKEYLPGIKQLGIVYNPGEANSVCLADLMDFYASSRGITIVKSTANKTVDVRSAAQNLVGKADAIYVPTDNTVISVIEAVVQVGRDARIPVFAGDFNAAYKGAVAGLGLDYIRIGAKTAEMVKNVLHHVPISSLPVQFVEHDALYVNLDAGKRMNVSHPQSVLERANKILEKNEKGRFSDLRATQPYRKLAACTDILGFAKLIENGQITVPVLVP